MQAGQATKELLAAIGEAEGLDVQWQVQSVQFQCDGCRLRRPDRPGPDEGWTYDDGNDYCPTCSEARPPTTDSDSEPVNEH